MRNTIISLAVFMIITSIAQANKVERTVEHELTRDGSHVKVEIKVGSPIATNNRYTFIWGAHNFQPSKQVRSIKIVVNNKVIPVPFSAYSDLTQYSRSSLEFNGSVYVLKIQGGDASTSYDAEIYFLEDVKNRKVFDGEFPEYIWEETIYHRDTPKGV